MALLALIAGTVSYLHMHTLAAMHGQPGAVGSIASLAANVAVAQPTVTGRLIAAWPSFALTSSYELLMRHVRRSATSRSANRLPVGTGAGSAPLRQNHSYGRPRDRRSSGLDLQREAWQWAQTNRTDDGSLPSGKLIAQHYARHERWGRLVKHVGVAGGLASHDTTAARSVNGTA